MTWRTRVAPPRYVKEGRAPVNGLNLMYASKAGDQAVCGVQQPGYATRQSRMLFRRSGE